MRSELGNAPEHVILCLAAGLAFVAEWREPGQGMAILGFAIMGVLVINAEFSPMESASQGVVGSSCRDAATARERGIG